MVYFISFSDFVIINKGCKNSNDSTELFCANSAD